MFRGYLEMFSLDDAEEGSKVEGELPYDVK